MDQTTGLIFNRSNGGPTLYSMPEINRKLRKVGSKICPLDLSRLPPDIRTLVDKPVLEDEEASRLQGHFLLSRERLLTLIREAGRVPCVDGGGALTTFVEPHNYAYPQLYLCEEGVDYSRFDRFHANAADDGTGVDEVLQLLCGGPVNVLHLAPGGDTLQLSITCPSPIMGWTLTYPGKHPHSGRIGDTATGTKTLVQVIGPPRWTMNYDCPQGVG